MKAKLFILTLSAIFLFGLFVFQSLQYADGRLHVVFCNIGQGDGIFIRTPQGSDIVVDGGPDATILKCLEKHMPFWDRDIELVFASHPDADHITGLESILKSYTVKSFNTSQKLKGTAVFKRIQALIDQNRVPFKFIFANDTYTISDGVTIKTYWPTQEHVNSDINGKLDANSFSLVQVLSFGNFKTLLTGDIEFEILDKLFPSGSAFDIFKLPHHGSKTGVDANTFEIIKPSLSIISSGKNNRYHHPSLKVLELLKEFNLQYKNTAVVGEIEIVTDGTTSQILGQ